MSVFKLDENFPPQFHIEMRNAIDESSIIRKFGEVSKVDSSSVTVPYHPHNLYEARWLKDGEMEQDTVRGAIQNITIRLGLLYNRFSATNLFVQEMGSGILRYMKNNMSISMGLQENRSLLLGSEDKSMQGLLQANEQLHHVKNNVLHTLLMKMCAQMDLYYDHAIWIANADFMAKIIDEMGETHLSMLLNINAAPDTKKHAANAPPQSILSRPMVLCQFVPADTILLVNLTSCYTFVENGDLSLSQTPNGSFSTNYCFSTRIGGAITNPDALIIGHLEAPANRSKS